MADTPDSLLRTSIRVGSYHDSVVLMRLQRALAARDGVLDAGVVMATPANREILAASGLLDQSAATAAAGAGDLLIAVRAVDAEIAAEALAQVDALLAVRIASGNAGYRPKSLDGAVRQLPDARWVVISVPGRFAARVADEALDRGKHVFLYSDNVPLAEELALKHKARERGLLVLGPDCGTAIVGGVGLGFANRVRRGNIGLVAASGTGLQAVASRVHAWGGGISQAIGLGGRDLSAAVGGVSALQALDLLARDPETSVIVLLGKPPESVVAANLFAAARRAGKPVVINLLGLAQPAERLGNVHFAASLAAAAQIAVALSRLPPPGSRALAQEDSGAAKYFRGLFSGGTLAYEIQLALDLALDPLWSNAPVGAAQALPDPLASRDHTVLDLGADEFTVGRLHPMIDPDLRLRRFRAEASDREVGLIALDVVLGDGAHADPAGVLAVEIERALALRSDLAIAALVVGTDADPQNLSEQVATLGRAGARVVQTTEELAAFAIEILPSPNLANESVPVPLDAVAPPLVVINVGIETFFDSLIEQGARALHVDWRPPAGGDERLAGLLARLRTSRSSGSG